MSVSKFAKWYKVHAEKLNKKRRKRYKTDPKYKQKQLLSTKRWRARVKKLRKQNPPPPVVKTKFTISDAAKKIGCDIQTIRLLERRGLLPSATDGRKHRVYTDKQIALMKPLITYRQETHYKAQGFEATVKKLSTAAFKGW